VNALLQVSKTSGMDVDGDEEAWNGIEEDVAPEPVDHEVDHEEEYVDEDKYTTVTVEAVDISKDGLQKLVDHEDSETEEEVEAKPVEKETNEKKKKWPKKEKKKKFRYESKAERRITREKQKAAKKGRAGARRGND